MPIGIYVRTIEHNKKISESLKKTHWSKKEPEKWKKHKEKLRNLQKGHIPWNKGLTKSDPRVLENTRKSGETLKRLYKEGKIKSPMKGLLGKNSPLWNGGSRNFYQKQARKMCEDAGWDIKGKIIHHKNEDFTDNRLENFHIMTRAEHLKHHNPLQHRKEWVAWNKGKEWSDEHKINLSKGQIKRYDKVRKCKKLK